MLRPESAFRLKSAANLVRRMTRLYWRAASPRPLGRLVFHYLRRATGGPAPLFLDIGVTYRCQCNCVHCAATAHGGSGDEFSTTELKSLISQAARLGVLEIILSGGEPLLREDLDEIIRHAARLGLLTRINTNGLLLDRARARRLNRAGLTQCAVSIDAADAETHDRVRRLPGTFEAAVRGVRALRNEGVPCQLFTYAGSESVPDGLRRVIELGRRLGVLGIFVFFPMAVGRWEGRYDRVLTAAQRRAVRELQDVSLVHLELPTSATNCCTLERLLLYATADGLVTPCPFVPHVIGSLREHSLRDLWRAYTDAMAMECPGRCPLNVPASGEALKHYVAQCSLRR